MGGSHMAETEGASQKSQLILYRLCLSTLAAMNVSTLLATHTRRYRYRCSRPIEDDMRAPVVESGGDRVRVLGEG